MKLKTYSIFTAFLLLAVLLVACSQGNASQKPEISLIGKTELPTTGVPTSTEAAPTEEVEESQNVIENTPLPQVEEPRPTPRTGLAATDPISVNLASGKPTLVEFFAFW